VTDTCSVCPAPLKWAEIRFVDHPDGSRSRVRTVICRNTHRVDEAANADRDEHDSVDARENRSPLASPSEQEQPVAGSHDGQPVRIHDYSPTMEILYPPPDGATLFDADCPRCRATTPHYRTTDDRNDELSDREVEMGQDNASIDVYGTCTRCGTVRDVTP